MQGVSLQGEVGVGGWGLFCDPWEARLGPGAQKALQALPNPTWLHPLPTTVHSLNSKSNFILKHQDLVVPMSCLLLEFQNVKPRDA